MFILKRYFSLVYEKSCHSGWSAAEYRNLRLERRGFRYSSEKRFGKNRNDSCLQILLFLLCTFFSGEILSQVEAFAPINPKNITIVRDRWGVPHIYSKTDAEASYGLAWAHAEDDFETMQLTLLAVKGLLSNVKGKDGAILDVLAFVTEADRVVEAAYDTAFSDKFKTVLNGYTQGINAYAVAHPEEMLHKKGFPLTEQDIIKGYVLAMALMTNVQFDIQRLLGDTIADDAGRGIVNGSNGIAISRNKTADGKTYLAVNSHQPLQGPFSWYEVHIETEEGWQFLGGTFPGGVTPFHGTNRYLGWAHTLNRPDLHDVYKLTMHPKEKNKYRFDGKWLELAEVKLKLGVKIWAFLKFPYRKTFYRSKYGLTFKTKKGYYALRFPANMEIRAAEQWYWMTKAKNFKQFHKAMMIQGSPGINTVYADCKDNIFYISNGLFPYRDPAYEWQKVLPGDISATLWEPRFMPLDSLPQLLNPACGYVFNMNNTPFNATGPGENLNAAHFDKTMGYMLQNTARSLRFGELMANTGKLSYDDFKKIKYDLTYPTPIKLANIGNFEDILHLDAAKFPDIADIITVLQKWNRNTDVENRQAAIIVLSIHYLLRHLEKQGRVDYYNIVLETDFADALRFAKKHLLKHFKTLEPQLGDVQVHTRGARQSPIWGGFDIMAQMYSLPYKDGKFRSQAGESYIQLVRYSEDGVEVETINAYGASARPESPHYTDQMDLYLEQKLKRMTFDREEIFREAKRIYHPEM